MIEFKLFLDKKTLVDSWNYCKNTSFKEIVIDIVLDFKMLKKLYNDYK